MEQQSIRGSLFTLEPFQNNHEGNWIEFGFWVKKNPVDSHQIVKFNITMSTQQKGEHTYPYYLVLQTYSRDQTILNGENFEEETIFQKNALSVVTKAKWNDNQVLLRKLRNLNLEQITAIKIHIQRLKPIYCPYLVKNFGFIQRADSPFTIVTEHPPANALSLAEVLKKSPEISTTRRCKFALDSALGLAYLHAYQIYHGEVTLNNFLVIAEELPRESGVNVQTQGYGILKIPSNIPSWTHAPELQTPSNNVNYFATDIYSFGAILTHIFRTPENSEKYQTQNTHEHFLHKPKLTLSELTEIIQFEALSHVPQSIRIVIEQCWKKNPDERPCMNEIVQYLREEFLTLLGEPGVGRPHS